MSLHGKEVKGYYKMFRNANFAFIRAFYWSCASLTTAQNTLSLKKSTRAVSQCRMCLKWVEWGSKRTRIQLVIFVMLGFMSDHMMSSFYIPCHFISHQDRNASALQINQQASCLLFKTFLLTKLDFTLPLLLHNRISPYEFLT